MSHAERETSKRELIKAIEKKWAELTQSGEEKDWTELLDNKNVREACHYSPPYLVDFAKNYKKYQQLDEYNGNSFIFVSNKTELGRLFRDEIDPADCLKNFFSADTFLAKFSVSDSDFKLKSAIKSRKILQKAVEDLAPRLRWQGITLPGYAFKGMKPLPVLTEDVIRQKKLEWFKDPSFNVELIFLNGDNKLVLYRDYETEAVEKAYALLAEAGKIAAHYGAVRFSASYNRTAEENVNNIVEKRSPVNKKNNNQDLRKRHEVQILIEDTYQGIKNDSLYDSELIGKHAFLKDLRDSCSQPNHPLVKSCKISFEQELLQNNSVDRNLLYFFNRSTRKHFDAFKSVQMEFTIQFP